ncbi:MAG TPA: ABC transporter permease [Candidatus Dormibacteraeota bacterium]|nr:ABC transporter permease [Candidatus Dormibacteraeota bacterium]
MTFYILRRLGIGVVLLLFMSVVFFALTRLTPGPPFTAGENPHAHQELIDKRLHNLGLDKPWYQQYPAYLGALLHGNLGDSYVYKSPVATLLGQRVPNSVLLLGVAEVVALLIAIPLGIFAATRQYSLIDSATSVISYTGVSVPSFVLGIFLLLLGGSYLRQWTGALFGVDNAFHFPLFGMHTNSDQSLPDLLLHMVMPVISLAILSIAGFSRYMRSSMLEVLHQDYIRTAKAKGLSPGKVNYKHALRNALLPIVTLVALQIPQFVSGAIITEGIFSWPGMGQLAFQATVDRDYPVILAVVMLVAVLTVIFNLVADVAYAVVDPRIRY